MITPTPVDIDKLKELVDDAVATLLAVRATTISSDEWEAARLYFRVLCGETIANLNAAALPALIAKAERVDALEAKVSELEVALEPFAQAADLIPDSFADALCLWAPTWSEKAIAAVFEFRRAKRVFAARNALPPKESE